MGTVMVMGMLKPKAGYTLLEILVVLVIISIVAGMAVLTVGHNHNKQLQAFTQELAQTLTLAEEQALLQPTTLGLELTPRSFRFYEYREVKTGKTWEPVADRELGLHSIPKDIQVSLQIAGKTLPLEALEGKAPSLLVSTNGTLTPFTILIGQKDKTPRYQLTGRSDGTVTSQVYEG
jgi:general secretion pathway protein H